VAAGGTFTFDKDTPITSGITHVSGTADITFGVAGTYKVSFVVAAGTLVPPQQVGLAINGVLQTQTNYMSAGQTSGQAMITVSAGDVLTLVNTGVSSISFALNPTTINASLTIEQIDTGVAGPGI
jgi:hypothetical protein